VLKAERLAARAARAAAAAATAAGEEEPVFADDTTGDTGGSAS
jgi:hypothetical protein